MKREEWPEDGNRQQLEIERLEDKKNQEALEGEGREIQAITLSGEKQYGRRNSRE